jgi:hypothetical protein
MTVRAKAPAQSRLRREILAMSKDMHKLGIMDDTTYRKITMREVNKARRTGADLKPPRPR